MEEPHRLKEESKNLIAGSEPSSAAIVVTPSDGASHAQDHAADARQIIINSAVEREAKKQADQEFLAEYKIRENRIRMGFISIVIFLVGSFSIGIPKFFEYTDHAKKVSTHFVPAIASAMIGEMDASTFQTSQFPIAGDQANVASAVDTRMRLIDESISKLEASGQPAIFSRLGAEQLLMRADQRKRGLTYGDVLISKYPELPSNYCYRADVDFRLGNFAQAVTEFDQFGALLKNASLKDKRAWAHQVLEAAWACIDSGNMEKAKAFLQAFEGDEIYEYEAQEMLADAKSAVEVQEYDMLDVPELQKTSYWNPELERYSKALLKKELVRAKLIPSYETDAQMALAQVYSRGHEFRKAQKEVNKLGSIFLSNKYYYNIGMARLALARDQPGVAIHVLEQEKDHPTVEIDYLLARALQQAHKNDQAIKVASKIINGYLQNSSEHQTGELFLPSVMVMARAMNDTGRFQEALGFCDQIIKSNPEMIAPRLLEIEINQKLNSKPEIIDRLRAELLAHLKK